MILAHMPLQDLNLTTGTGLSDQLTRSLSHFTLPYRISIFVTQTMWY